MVQNSFLDTLVSTVQNIGVFMKGKVIPGFSTSRNELVVDLGCGDKPFWRADVFVDKVSLGNEQRYEDYEVWLNMVVQCQFPVIAEALALYRWHAGQMSATLARQAAETRLVLEAFLMRHPEGWTAAGRSRLRRRVASLAREEAYASLLAANRGVAAAAAWRSITWCVAQPKSWLYLALAPLPGVYARLRRLRKRIEG